MNQATGRGLHGYRLSEQVAGYEGLKVYRAISPGGRVLVSIRLFPSSISTFPHILKKFNQTAELLSQADHPNICPLIDWGSDQGRPYLIHPYIDAGSLEARMQSGTVQALDPDQVFYDLASALTYAHETGLVHGNLRPSDILFDEDGEIQVVGFGEALVLGALTGNRLRRLPSFRAPESGNVQNISAASDQYSIAIIALQMITNLPSDQALEVLHSEERRIENSAKTRRTFTTTIPDAMVSVLSRALSENPSKRFPSVEAAEAAYRTATGRAVVSNPTPTLASIPVLRSEAVPKVQKKRRRAWRSLLLVLILLGVSVSAGIAFWEKAELGGSNANEVVHQNTEGISLPPERQYPGENLTDAGEMSPTSESAVPGNLSPTPSPQTNDTSKTGSAQTKPANTSPAATATSSTLSTATPEQPPGSDPTVTAPSPTDTAPAPTQEPGNPSGKCSPNPNSKHYCPPTSSP